MPSTAQDVIKTCATGGVLSEADKVDSPQLTQAELDALVDEAHALGRKTAAHAHGAEGAKRAIRAGIDSIEHGSFLDDEAFDLMRKKGTYFVPTPLPCIMQRLRDARAPANIIEKAAAADAKAVETLKRAISKNARIAFGSDAAVCPHGTQLNQFEIFVKSGMKTLAAIRTRDLGGRGAARGARPWNARVGEAGRRRRGARRSVAGHRGDGAGLLRDEGRCRRAERPRRRSGYGHRGERRRQLSGRAPR
jgi:hypothetical protein